jgi:hypothetical protein
MHIFNDSYIFMSLKLIAYLVELSLVPSSNAILEYYYLSSFSAYSHHL